MPGTNIPDSQLSDLEVLGGYKGQGAVERGFRFLKSPVFFVSSLYVKKPSRIEGLLMVMTLALLVDCLISCLRNWGLVTSQPFAHITPCPGPGEGMSI